MDTQPTTPTSNASTTTTPDTTNTLDNTNTPDTTSNTSTTNTPATTPNAFTTNTLQSSPFPSTTPQPFTHSSPSPTEPIPSPTPPSSPPIPTPPPRKSHRLKQTPTKLKDFHHYKPSFVNSTVSKHYTSHFLNYNNIHKGWLQKDILNRKDLTIQKHLHKVNSISSLWGEGEGGCWYTTQSEFHFQKQSNSNRGTTELMEADLYFSSLQQASKLFI
ncbi:hypothetical protein Tco_0688669 [Tanacetum coccineum]